MHSDPKRRAAILGDELTQTIDEIGAVFQRHLPAAWGGDVALLFRLFGDFWAHTLGRATVLAAGAIRVYDDRLTAVERAVGERRSDGLD
jgi:hypothetical protein